MTDGHLTLRPPDLPLSLPPRTGWLLESSFCVVRGSFFGAVGPVGSVLTKSVQSVGTRHVKLSTCLPIDLTWDMLGYHDLSASQHQCLSNILHVLRQSFCQVWFCISLSCAQPETFCWDVGWQVWSNQEAEVWCLERRAFRELVIRSFSNVGDRWSSCGHEEDFGDVARRQTRSSYKHL